MRRSPSCCLPAALAIILGLSSSACAPPQPAGEVEAPEDLSSLAYLTWVPSEGEDGVSVLDRERSQPGLNLYSSRHEPAAQLIDSGGNVVYRWRNRIRAGDSWLLVDLVGEGDLLAMDKDRRIARFDRNSKLLWKTSGRYHHDFFRQPDGSLVVLGRRDRILAQGEPEETPLLEDIIVTMSENGKILSTISLFDSVRELVPENLLASARRWWRKRHRQPRFRTDSPPDVTHTNSIAVLAEGIEGVAPAGSWLVSVRNVNRIVMLEPGTGKLLWHWGEGMLGRQHHASELGSGRLLVFDNLGAGEGFSRVLELDAASGQVVWEFRSAEQGEFFSHRRGGAQRLPNGNTLITLSDSGRSLEVTAQGEVVWEFRNPSTRQDEGELPERAAIYRMTRIVDTERLGWLRRSRVGG